MSGLLFCEVGVALFESGEENGVFVAQSGVFVLQNGVFLAPGLGLSLTGANFSSLQYSASLRNWSGLLFPLKRFGLELIGSIIVMN